MSRYAALAGRIRTGLSDCQKTAERAEMLSRKALQTEDDGYWDGVALNLHSFYTGVEHIFKISAGPSISASPQVLSGIRICWFRCQERSKAFDLLLSLVRRERSWTNTAVFAM